MFQLHDVVSPLHVETFISDGDAKHFMEIMRNVSPRSRARRPVRNISVAVLKQQNNVIDRMRYIAITNLDLAF